MERVPNLHGREDPLSDMVVGARRTTDWLNGLVENHERREMGKMVAND